MTSHYSESLIRFRLLQSTWGIFALIKAKVEPLRTSSSIPNNNDVHQISERVWLDFNNSVIAPKEDQDLMLKGLKSVAEDIEVKIEEEIMIVITDFQFALNDYQKEGMYYAFSEWATQHFELSQKEVNVQFDQESNAYVFPDLT